jgi:pimeloyl-ACP methyl ester carboxylesterase
MISNKGVSYRVSGAGEQTIVFVHGFACAQEDWQAQIEALSGQFRCVTLDLPGHGESAKPPAATLGALGDAVNEVRRLTDARKVILVGHSLGAKVIREAYSAMPDGVAGLVFIDGAFYDGDHETMLNRAASAIDSHGFAAYASAHFDSMFTENSDPKLKEHIVARAAGLDPEFGRALYLQAVTWDPARGKQTLRELAAPVLVLQSTHIGADLVRRPIQPGTMTSFMTVVTELVAKSEAKLVLGVGHFTMNEAPDEVSGLIRDFALSL